MISCGEPSGDLYAGALVDALREREPGIEVFGLGGARLQAAGADLVGDFRGMAVTGLTEVLGLLPRTWTLYRSLVQAARDRRPDALVVIDYPDFNFFLMRAVRRLGIPVVYYVSPQLWAWRPGRMRTMKRVVDRVLPIFPFEEELYRREGIDVRFVGHPLIDLASTSGPRDQFLARLKLDASRPVVALLPGSRANELSLLAPVMAAAAPAIAARVPGAQFLVARAPHLSDRHFEVFGISGLPLRIVEGQTDDVLAASDAVVTASGTATVQAALHGTPMVVLYKLSPLTYRLLKPLGTVDMYAMANLIAGSRIVQELIQEACTPEAVADEAVRLVTDAAYRTRMIGELAEVRRRLGGPGASGRAADAIIETIELRGRRKSAKFKVQSSKQDTAE